MQITQDQASAGWEGAESLPRRVDALFAWGVGWEGPSRCPALRSTRPPPLWLLQPGLRLGKRPGELSPGCFLRRTRLHSFSP